MEKTETKPITVFDAGPLIHLDELNILLLLEDFHVYIPDTVWQEVLRHRPTAVQQPPFSYKRCILVNPISPSLFTLSNTLGLDVGEIEALSLVSETPNAIFLTDDAAARLAANQFGYPVHGSIGLLLRAVRRNRLSGREVISLLRKIPQTSSLHIRASLLHEIIHNAQHTWGIENS